MNVGNKLLTCFIKAEASWTCKGYWFGTCSKSGSLQSSMKWSFFILINSLFCYVVTSISMSSSPPSIIMIHWQMKGFFFDNELVGSRLNWSLGVNGSIYIFTQCDYQTSHGNMLTECIDQHSLMNWSLVTNSRKGSLNCSTTTFFFFFA